MEQIYETPTMRLMWSPDDMLYYWQRVDDKKLSQPFFTEGGAMSAKNKSLLVFEVSNASDTV